MGDQQKPGRNDPCHCGSGKKFKKCHGIKQAVGQAAGRASFIPAPAPPPTHFIVMDAKLSQQCWADAFGRLLVFRDKDIAHQLIREYFPTAKMTVLGMSQQRWSKYQLQEPRFTVVRSYTDGEYLLRQRLEQKGLETMEERCGACAACVVVSAFQKDLFGAVVVLSHDPAIRAEEILLQQWNQMLIDHPCEQWDEQQVKAFRAAAARISEPIRPKIPEHT